MSRNRKIIVVITSIIVLLFSTSTSAVLNSNINFTSHQEEIISYTYGNKGCDKAYSVIATSDGGYALAGESNADMWLVKTNATGHEEWNRFFVEDNTSLIASSIIQTSDGGYALAGETTFYDSVYSIGNTDIILVKTNAYGLMEWKRTFGGEEKDYASSVIVTADDGFILAGYTESYGNGDSDMWLVKTDYYGRLEWNKTFGGVFHDHAESIIQTSDGGYIIAGYTDSYDHGRSGDMWLVKINATGHKEWDQAFGGNSADRAFSVIATADGGYALAGFTWSYSAGYKDMWLVKTNATGHIEWNQTFGGVNYDEAFSVIATADGGYALAGSTWSYGAGGSDMWLVKTDAYGNEEWSQTFGINLSDEAFTVITSTDSGYVLAGYIWSENTNYDMCLIKTTLEDNTNYIISIANLSKTSHIGHIFILSSLLVLTVYYKRKEIKK